MVIEKYPHIIKESQCTIYMLKKALDKEIYFNHQSLSHPYALSHFKPLCLAIMQKILNRI
jgi:hypothetical protein